jgi:uncharacterized protein
MTRSPSAATPLAAILLTAALTFTGTVRASAQDAAAPTAPSVTAPVAAPAAPADPASIAAALELMDVTGASKSFDNITSMMRQHVSAGAADAAGTDKMKTFDDMMAKFATYKPDMLKETAAVYAQKFSAAELKTISEFYKSGPGAKFITAMPDLMKDGGAIGQKYAMKMMQEFRAAKKPE